MKNKNCADRFYENYERSILVIEYLYQDAIALFKNNQNMAIKSGFIFHTFTPLHF